MRRYQAALPEGLAAPPLRVRSGPAPSAEALGHMGEGHDRGQRFLPIARALHTSERAEGQLMGDEKVGRGLLGRIELG